MTALRDGRRAHRRDVPRRRRVGQLPGVQGGPRSDAAPHRRQGGRVQGRPRARRIALRRDAGSFRMLFNGVDIATIASAAPVRASRPTVFFCGRHEQRKGLAVLLEAFATLPVRRAPVDRRRRPRRRRPARQERRRRTHLVARAHRRRREVRTPTRRVGVLRPIAARRVVRRGADRSDGGAHPGRGQRSSTATATSPPTASTPSSSNRATPRRWPTPSPVPSPTTRSPPACARRVPNAPRTSR